ncbi:hypothetical protein [Capillimicrobium parvum]|uniref:Uncharacterized protein n=1 Tax=Capillimicrobium parvum TaxID=2884022 RepID=A0A9E6XWB1_9ACTN|nr:hypothetical protein [Capillimicrobium parvum]UGS35634.1 hypothetical protein DSM104329_02029 [Capillimicrobium parvum]
MVLRFPDDFKYVRPTISAKFCLVVGVALPLGGAMATQDHLTLTDLKPQAGAAIHVVPNMNYAISGATVAMPPSDRSDAPQFGSVVRW